MPVPKVVIDTNIFVAAGFNAGSSSAKIVEMIERDALVMIWNEATRRESAQIVEKIPRLSWQKFASLFRERDEWTAETVVANFRQVEDRDDRKFAALAHAAGAVLISNDDHLLSQRDAIDVQVLRPSDFLKTLNEAI